MAVTVLPGAGQRPTQGLGEAAQTMLQFFLQREQLEQQEQQQDFRERQFEFQQQVQQTEQAQQTQAAQAGRALVANMVQQNPQLAQSIQAAFPGARQIEVSGDPLAGDVQQTQTFDPRGIPAAAAPALAEGLQTQQQTAAQTALAEAQTERTEAQTTQVEVETDLARTQADTQERLANARISLTEAQTEAERNRARTEIINSVQDIVQTREEIFATTFNNLAATGRTPDEARIFASSIAFGSPQRPDPEQFTEQMANSVLRLAESPNISAEDFGSLAVGNPATQLAERLGIGPVTQSNYDATLTRVDNPQTAFRDITEAIRERADEAGLSDQQTNAQLGAAKIYFEAQTGATFRVSDEERRGWMNDLMTAVQAGNRSIFGTGLP